MVILEVVVPDEIQVGLGLFQWQSANGVRIAACQTFDISVEQASKSGTEPKGTKESPLEDRLWTTFKKFGIQAERQEFIAVDKRGAYRRFYSLTVLYSK